MNLNPTIATAQYVSDTYTKYAWKKLVRECIEAADEAELHQSMFRTESGIFYSTIKTKYGPEPYVFAHDRKSAMLKFYLRSRSFGLQARIHHHGQGEETAKQCKLCSLNAEENEGHYLLICLAFAAERQDFARKLVINLKVFKYPGVLDNIRAATNNQLVGYLLGGSEPDWTEEAIALIDKLIRPYLLQLAAKRKRLMVTT